MRVSSLVRCAFISHMIPLLSYLCRIGAVDEPRQKPAGKISHDRYGVYTGTTTFSGTSSIYKIRIYRRINEWTNETISANSRLSLRDVERTE